jgi:alkylation response protein AidB-like acyl-CoA dehydrogenase
VSGPTEAGQAVAEVARSALSRDVGWKALAAAGLTALPVPAAYGGDGLGPADLAPLLTEAGRQAVELPVGETLWCAALLLATHGSPEQQEAHLPGVASGDRLVVPALAEPVAGITGTPTTSYADGRVTGRKVAVTWAEDATLLVTASGPDGPIVCLVAPDADGLRLEDAASSSGLPRHTVVLEGAPAEVLPGEGAADRLVALALSGLAIRGSGLVAGALELTADYVKHRTQFGRALAEFQAVAQQVADVYIDARLLTLAGDNAAWRLDRELPLADDLAVAAYWTAARALPALHVCQHLHGGMGVDATYPLAAYFSQVSDLTHLLGGPRLRLEHVRIEDEAAKNLELSEEQRALKAELREYFTGLAGEAGHEEGSIERPKDRHGETYQRIIKQMGRDGWMGVGWPTEYGGRGLGEIEQTIFANEAQRADVHLPAVTLQTVGPTLQRFGTPAQKERFLGPILAGDVHFAIGYSEPDAGTDLASLRCSARLVEEGEGAPFYLVNGQKLWTTGGHQADYIWLAVRTDADAPKHRGISILIVDTTDPGYSWTPIITADGSHHVNATSFEDVKVPVDMLVGEENDGWRLITAQLNHERVMLGPAGRLEGLRDRVANWAAEHGVADEPDVRRSLGEVTAAFRVNELLNWQVARAAEGGEIDVADASASKVFASEEVQRLGRLLAEVVHRYGDPSEPGTKRLMDYLDGQAKRNLVLTFGGGVNEVQRELIAMFGLGLPRVPR